MRCPATLLVGVVVALTIGLADPALSALAAATDTPTLLPVDQPIDDGNDRVLFLVPAVAIDDLVQGSLLRRLGGLTTWPAWACVVSDLARAPPRTPGARFVFPQTHALGMIMPLTGR